MKTKLLIGALSLLLIIGLSGCTSGSGSDTKAANATADTGSDTGTVSGSEANVSQVTVINAKEALAMMDESDDLLILDVRTQEEFTEGHIKNAVLLPYDTITEASKELPVDKAKTILVYCRSGRRSAIAAQTLADLGYTAVYDFGGIIDWPYEVVTE